MAKKYIKGYYPETFHKHLVDKIPGLGLEEASDQRGFVYLSWGCQSSRYDHASLSREGYKFVPHQILYSLFDRGRSRQRFPLLNRRLEMFEVMNYDKHHGEAKAYRPTPKVIDACLTYSEAYPVTGDPIELIDVNTGKAVAKLTGNAILSKDFKNRTTVTQQRGKMEPWCPVNVDELMGAEKLLQTIRAQVHQGRHNEALTEQLQFFGWSNFEHRDLSRWIDLRLVSITHILHQTNTTYCPKGSMPSRYTEYESGRLYPYTYPHLQTTPRELKRVALSGCWEYDFSNCHFSLFIQMTERLGYQADHIRDYIDRKAEVRKLIAHDTGLTIEQVKESLLALIYGAADCRGKANPHFSKNSILNICGFDGGKHDRLVTHPLFKGIARDLKAGQELLIDDAPKSRGRIRNAMGKYIDQSKRRAQKLGHLLQGAEAMCLNTILRHYGDRIILLQHDGWNTTERLNVGEAEHWIAKETGFEMRIEEELLPVDDLQARWERWSENDPESGAYKSTHHQQSFPF
ncbi:MAG: hypothetical protein QF732_05615 [Nitrospinaceae bacterium]|mgnify:FL=1|jgi:hypothetical protein|nr:hypothetical protein [Nitrospinaceae bacterium]|tara:strand:+ start:320 stop:1867 length:1548 start_codon:yes stop_codon:yes gene_type:complete